MPDYDNAIYIMSAEHGNIELPDKGDEGMDMEKYLDRLDQDRRESEQRLQANMDKMESRLTEERRLSEERLNRQLEEDRANRKELEERMNKNFSELSSDMKTTKWAIIGLCITTILGIAAMVVTVVLS